MLGTAARAVPCASSPAPVAPAAFLGARSCGSDDAACRRGGAVLLADREALAPADASGAFVVLVLLVAVVIALARMAPPRLVAPTPVATVFSRASEPSVSTVAFCTFSRTAFARTTRFAWSIPMPASPATARAVMPLPPVCSYLPIIRSLSPQLDLCLRRHLLAWPYDAGRELPSAAGAPGASRATNNVVRPQASWWTPRTAPRRPPEPEESAGALRRTPGCRSSSGWARPRREADPAR